MKTSPLPVKGCTFWPIIGTHDHWSMSVLKRSTPSMTHDIPLLCSYPIQLTSVAECLARELLLSVLMAYMYMYDYRGWGFNTQPSACNANALTDCSTSATEVWSRCPFVYYNESWNLTELMIIYKQKSSIKGRLSVLWFYKVMIQNVKIWGNR